MPLLDAVRHLIGLQAQLPFNPYVALWSRLDGFDPDELGQLLVDREVVRLAVMRGTLHLVTADDALALRALAQPVLERELRAHQEFKDAIENMDVERVLDIARPLLAREALTPKQLRTALTSELPDIHATAAVLLCRNRIPLVQVPPRGVWGRTAQVTLMDAEAFLGKRRAAHQSIDDVALRYFAAHGPATVADLSAWSGLTGMREVVERLRPQLRPFTDERGRELFDLDDAPRPDADTPAPTRFFPEYDNVFLGLADRSRFEPPETPSAVGPTPDANGSVLHDGFWCGTWRVSRDKRTSAVTLTVDQTVRLTKRAVSALTAEGYQLLRLIAADAETHAVRVNSPV